jgi:hypothetical protein
VCVKDVNVVEVAVTFQPAPEPVASPMSNGSVAVIVWFAPFSAVVGNVSVAAGVLLMKESVPELSVTDAAVEACAVSGSDAMPALASAQTAASHVTRFLEVYIGRSPVG